MSGIELNRPIKDVREEESLFRQRAWIGFIVIAVLTGLLAIRYLYLQVIAHEDFTCLLYTSDAADD